MTMNYLTWLLVRCVCFKRKNNMKKEIRGLQTGLFQNNDKTASLLFSVSDDGVIVELVDCEFDLYQKWVIDNNNVKHFEWNSFEEIQKEDMNE